MRLLGGTSHAQAIHTLFTDLVQSVSPDGHPVTDEDAALIEQMGKDVHEKELQAQAQGNAYQHAVEKAELPWVPDDNVKHAFIWYSAAEDNTDKTLPPVWESARKIYTKLKASSNDPNQHIRWVKKVCYDKDWSAGENFSECPLDQKLPNRIKEFPTLRLYSDAGEDDFVGQRSVPEVVNFVRRIVDPPERLPSRNPPHILEERLTATGSSLMAKKGVPRIGEKVDSDERVMQLAASNVHVRHGEVVDAAVGPLLGCAGAVVFSASQQDLWQLWAAHRHARKTPVQRRRVADCSDFL